MARVEYEENAVEKLEKLGQGSLQNAVLFGDKDNGSFMSGQCACMLTEEQPAAQIIAELFDNARLQSVCNNVSNQLLNG
jgi:enoyl-[acyl-carrier protein] reductase II